MRSALIIAIVILAAPSGRADPLLIVPSAQSAKAAELEQTGNRYRHVGMALTVVATLATIASIAFLVAEQFSYLDDHGPCPVQHEHADTYRNLSIGSAIAAGVTGVAAAISWSSGASMVDQANRMRTPGPSAMLTLTWRF